MDFADGEGRLEKFAVRFKTPEQATDFKNVFEKAAREEATNAKSPANQMASTSDLKTSSTLQGFGNQATLGALVNFYRLWAVGAGFR